MPADTPTPVAPLNLDDRVPCASCGGEFVWIEFPSDRNDPRSYDGRCRCGVVWCDMPAPVTWRTLTAYSDMEVPAAYVARLVEEVDRLTAERDELAAQTAAIRALLEQHLGGWTEATTPHPEQPEMGPMPTLVEGVAALVADRDFAFARVEELERAASEALAARGAK